MSIFGDFEQFVAENLYPYRWPITVGFVAAVAVFCAAALRQGWHLIVWRHRLLSALVAVGIVAVAIPLGNYLLSPLWERSFLEEESPLALADGLEEEAAPVEPAREPSPASPNAATPAIEEVSFQPRVSHQGEISGADSFHFGRGTAQLIETEQGSYTLRFEDFSVRNGPDLFVYLTPDENSVDAGLNLGELKATDGAFNYEVPAGTDLTQHAYVVVWCRQFAVLFASAPLAEV